jgi:hypothetical protein
VSVTPSACVRVVEEGMHVHSKAKHLQKHRECWHSRLLCRSVSVSFMRITSGPTLKAPSVP